MPYHHGHARDALLMAAAELIETTGAAALSLRQVAERAGLSRQAPYNHFADKEALLAELAGAGFEALDRALAAIDAELAPVDRLAEAAWHYMGLGENRPATFRLMFGRELVDIRRYPVVQGRAAAVLRQLQAIVGAAVPGADPAEKTLQAWCLVHGATTLQLEIGLNAGDRRDLARSLATLIAPNSGGLRPQAPAGRGAAPRR